MLKLLGKIGLNESRIHLAGMSMGGMVTGMYTIKYPDHVQQVTIMCPSSKFIIIVIYFLHLINFDYSSYLSMLSMYSMTVYDYYMMAILRELADLEVSNISSFMFYLLIMCSLRVLSFLFLK